MRELFPHRVSTSHGAQLVFPRSAHDHRGHAHVRFRAPDRDGMKISRGLLGV